MVQINVEVLPTAATQGILQNFPLMEGSVQCFTPKHWDEAAELRL